ncbi:cobaltochelatase subunit CobN [Cytobacillus massiliigabonensis]|uniref:cobaltochelatase subunit CobN n=1 Tax=Cytobacillus massiliigabonensis TaxID=1871011 RepID=UPI000C81C75B|nr:cobaltochelatase subunit CobN [Cytobacillus massiliigabonensis]
MHITFITSATGILVDSVTAYKKFNKCYPSMLTMSLFDAKSSVEDKEKGHILVEAIKKSDLIIVDLRLCPVEWVTNIKAYLQYARPDAEKIYFSIQEEQMKKQFKLGNLLGEDLVRLLVSDGQPPSLFVLDNKEKINKYAFQLPEEKQNHFHHLAAIVEYWMYANEEYINQLLIFLAKEYGDGNKQHLPEPYKPLIKDDLYIYDDNQKKVYESFSEYEREFPFNQEKPVIGVLFLGYHFRANNVKCVQQIIERLKPMANIIPILAPGIASIDVNRFRDLLGNDKFKVNVLVNFVPFRIGAGPMGGNSHEVVPFLEELGVPIFHPFFITRRTVEQWKESIQGIDSSEYLTSVMLPELDGSIGTFPVGGLMDVNDTLVFEFNHQELVLIEERVQSLLNRVEKTLVLQKKENRDKKVAIICYNYPPGEDSLFSASYIDTFASVINVLNTLRKEGYKVPEVTKEQLLDQFTAGKLVNSGKWGTETTYSGFLRYESEAYEGYMGEKQIYKELTQDWGHSPGSIMVDGTDFLIPGMILGNVFIGLQPARSTEDMLANSYHDKSLHPHHQYAAFYCWLKDAFQADAMVHVGTHGTLEFLKGKEVAVSGDCTPDELIGDVPHVYIYYIGNPSEAMIAKRRTHAVLVSYQTPPYVTSDLYGEYVELEELLANYSEAEKLDPNRCANLYTEIKKRVHALHFTATTIHEIEIELYQMKRSLIPKGLHIFGNGYNDEEARNYMKQVLRYDRGTLKSIKRIISEDNGKNYDRILKNCLQEEMERLDEVENLIVNQFIDTCHFDNHLLVSEESRKNCYESLKFGFHAYMNSIRSYEEQGLLQALSGRYLPVKLAGDIVKNPEILPSGLNLYQFDPRLIPEKTAAKRGKIIAENTITQYYEEFGNYPASTGIVLWGFETSRTQGETIGQILHYLGVRVQVSKGSFKPNYEIIPIKELGRPRIDVVIHMTGFFRDIFPNVIEDLSGLFLKIARLDESENDNYLKANTNRIFEKLSNQGYEEEEAFHLAAARIFGPSEGAYSTRVTSLIGERNWQEESDLAKGYVEDIQYVYGIGSRGKPSSQLLKLHLEAVDLVSQIRSNLELEVVDLDHYFEYFGGFSKAVEVERGRKTPVYISDTTGELIQTEDVKKSIERGVRTRVLNPKWIDGLLAHEQHGTQQILERFENLIGLAATTNKVDSWIFSELNSTYIADEKRREELIKNNRFALHSMMERLFESHTRGYWDANEEELKQLKEAYLQLEGSIEEKV